MAMYKEFKEIETSYQIKSFAELPYESRVFVSKVCEQGFTTLGFFSLGVKKCYWLLCTVILRAQQENAVYISGYASMDAFQIGH